MVTAAGVKEMAAEAGPIEVLMFTLRGKLAHFRQPDTTVTQGTYPFPPRPTLHGLLGAILGIDHHGPDWPRFLAGEHYLGLRLLAPVRTVCMQMSLLGKGFVSSGKNFNRLTVMEMVVAPAYRVYYAGESLDALRNKLVNRQSVFHTYLGAAFCLTFPVFEGVCAGRPVAPAEGEAVRVHTVVPQEAVARVELEAPAAYAAARGMPYHHRGDRTFSGATTVYYEINGGPLKVVLAAQPKVAYRLVALPSGEVACLW
jgi:CRISPR-associated protein Cas5h